jgi:hypothetical protein
MKINPRQLETAPRLQQKGMEKLEAAKNPSTAKRVVEGFFG